jgi:hypothetical protein
MEILAGVSTCVLILTALTVVIRTLALWRRTRGTAELLLSGYLTGATVLGYPLIIASTRIPPDELWPLHLSGLVVMAMGFLCLMLFTVKVFRPDVIWARILVGVGAALWTGIGVAYFLELTGGNPQPVAKLVGINLTNSLSMAAAYFWTAGESLTYHRKLRLRLKLGLVEVAVVNRVLLWGLMSLAAGWAVLISLAGMLNGELLTTSLLPVFSLFGIFHAGCLFLAFHPPGWYRAWLEGRRPAKAG